MGPVILLLLLVVPLIELAIIVKTAESIGVPSTLGLLIAVSISGAWLLKQQGLATWRRVQETLERGEMPARELSDGAMILFGGALLLTPGFFTDVVGLILLLPPTRASVKGLFRRSLGRWARRRFGYSPSREARVVRVERSEKRTDPSPERSAAGSRGDLPRGEADSPDRR
ncbi:MAG: FxsA family protein [Actinomycetota bacterium]